MPTPVVSFYSFVTSSAKSLTRRCTKHFCSFDSTLNYVPTYSEVLQIKVHTKVTLINYNTHPLIP